MTDRLRHPSEKPFYIFMAVLNVAIVRAALVLPFLPARLRDTELATALRTACWACCY